MNSLTAYFTNLFKQLQHFLFPLICGICHQPSQVGEVVCPACRSFLPWALDRCFRCGARKSDLEIEQSPHNPSLHCPGCENCPPAFDRLCAVFSYDSPISDLILGLKFQKKLYYGALLGQLLSEIILSWYQNTTLPEAVIPVPLHSIRLRQRGYNQSLELLNPVRKLLQQYHIPILETACIRIRHTPPQARLKIEKRARNLQQAFQIAKKIPYKHVVILDDVVTTGSTVNALTKVLKSAGVEMVDIWCLCRD